MQTRRRGMKATDEAQDVRSSARFLHQVLAAVVDGDYTGAPEVLRELGAGLESKDEGARLQAAEALVGLGVLAAVEVLDLAGVRGVEERGGDGRELATIGSSGVVAGGSRCVG